MAADGPPATLGLVIREARRDDLDAIVAMLADDHLGAAREAPGDPGYAIAFDAIAASQRETLLVAERDGVVVGCLQLTLLPGLSRRGAWRALIEGVRVASPLRGRGIGEALVEAALARAGEAGATMAQLTTDRSRIDAHRFYERLGFVASHVGMKRSL